MTSTQIRSFAAMLIASVLVCACTPRSSPDPEAAIEVATGENVQIPEEFPKDVPLPEGLAVENVSALAAQGTYVVIGRVPGLLETVVPDLKRQIEEHGWTEVSPVQQEDMRDMKMMNFEKESKMLHVTLFREDNGTSVNVTTSPK
jgi:hypothetical protein